MLFKFDILSLFSCKVMGCRYIEQYIVVNIENNAIFVSLYRIKQLLYS